MVPSPFWYSVHSSVDTIHVDALLAQAQRILDTPIFEEASKNPARSWDSTVKTFQVRGYSNRMSPLVQ